MERNPDEVNQLIFIWRTWEHHCSYSFHDIDLPPDCHVILCLNKSGSRLLINVITPSYLRPFLYHLATICVGVISPLVDGIMDDIVTAGLIQFVLQSHAPMPSVSPSQIESAGILRCIWASVVEIHWC